MIAGSKNRDYLHFGHKNLLYFYLSWQYRTFSANGKSGRDVINKIGQNRRPISKLNSAIWNNKFTKNAN